MAPSTLKIVAAAVGFGGALASTDIKISKIEGCLGDDASFVTTNFYPVWAPGVCQDQPDGDYEGGQWDGHSFQGTAGNKIIIECSEDPDDELIVMRSYDNSDDCSGTATRTTIFRPNFATASEDILGFDGCTTLVHRKTVFPQFVIDACAPVQPQGPQLEITETNGCTIASTSEQVSVIWAPGQCQRSPWDITQSITLECDPSVDEGVRLSTFKRLNCEFLDSEYTVAHNVAFAPGGGPVVGPNAEAILANDSCRRFAFPQAIRDACKIPTAEPTPAPTNSPTLSPTDACALTEKLNRVRKHKRVCRQYRAGPESSCEAAACRYNERRNKCKPLDEDVISCLDISADHCCKFAGCFVNGMGSCVGNFEGYGN